MITLTPEELQKVKENFERMRKETKAAPATTRVYAKDLVGKVFKRLTVLRLHKKPGDKYKKQIFLECRCECGEVKIIPPSGLLNGSIVSCGCLRRDRHLTHGMSYRPEYKAWDSMIQRCNTPSDRRYRKYGGRGITVCDEWSHSFENFYMDMGDKPSPEYSLDRIDNNKGYCKDNCRWTTEAVQQRNRSNNRMFTYKGETLCFTDWANRYGLGFSTLWYRLVTQGWDIEKALLTPPGKKS